MLQDPSNTFFREVLIVPGNVIVFQKILFSVFSCVLFGVPYTLMLPKYLIVVVVIVVVVVVDVVDNITGNGCGHNTSR